MAVDASKIEEMLARIDELPTLPTVACKLLELLRDENVQAKHVADVIAADQALSSKVLKVVNSSFYSLPKRIGSVSQAVVILGFSQIRNIVIGTSVIDVFEKPGIHQGYFSPETFWPHSIGTAAASSVIGKIAEARRPEDAFTAGLLHGVGLLVIDNFFPDVMREIQERVEVESMTLAEAEEELLGFDHARLGARLLQEWRLPDEIVNAVQYHTQVDLCPPEHMQLAACVHLGDVFCRVLGHGSAGEPTVPAVNEVALDVLGIPANTFSHLLEPLDEEIEKSAVFLDSGR